MSVLLVLLCGALRGWNDPSAPRAGVERALVAIVPGDSIARSVRGLDDLENVALPKRRSDLLRLDDDAVVGLGCHATNLRSRVDHPMRCGPVAGAGPRHPNRRTDFRDWPASLPEGHVEARRSRPSRMRSSPNANSKSSSQPPRPPSWAAAAASLPTFG